MPRGAARLCGQEIKRKQCGGDLLYGPSAGGTGANRCCMEKNFMGNVKQRILIADDSPMNQEILSEILGD